MTTIRVDPSQLRHAARAIAEDAARLRAVGDEVLGATHAAPSYDGQFGPKVGSIGIEGAARLRAEADRLGELSQRLLRKAEEFETADAQAAAGLGAVGQALLSWREAGLQYLADAGLSWSELRRELGGGDDGQLPPALAWLLGFVGLILRPLRVGVQPGGPMPADSAILTPLPPGKTPTATPSPTMAVAPTAAPTAQGTPTAEEIWAQKRQLAERRLEEMWVEYRRLQEQTQSQEDSWFKKDPYGYVLAMNEQVYREARVDIDYYVSHKMNNPLSSDAFVGAEPMMMFSADEVNTPFVASLGLDQMRPSNFEPVFLGKLRQAYPSDFDRAEAGAEVVYLDNLARIYVSPRFRDLLRMLRQGRYGAE